MIGYKSVSLSIIVLLGMICAGSRVNVIGYPTLGEAFVIDGKSAQQTGAVPAQSSQGSGDAQEAENHFRAAEQALENKDTNSALAALEKAVALDPASAKYLSKYGAVAVSGAAYDRAVSFLIAQIERRETAALRFQAGKIETERLRRDPNMEVKQQATMQAIGHLSKAIDLDPKHLEARLNRGIVYYFIPLEFNLITEAIADFEWLVKERPDLAVAYRFLADSYLKLKDQKRAREVLKAAVERFPQDQQLRERLEKLDAPQR